MTDGPRIGLGDGYPHLQGGAQLQARLLATAWRHRGLDVRLVVPRLGPLATEAAAAGIPTTVVPATGALARYGGRARVRAAARLPGYWARARRAFTGRDVAHLHDHRGVLLWGPAARAAGAAVVWHLHATAAGPALDRVCAALADAIVVPTAAVAERCTHLGDVTVVPGVVPRPDARWDPDGSPRIVTVGRLFDSKGLDTLLEAVARLRPRLPDVHLDVIGGPDPTDDRAARALRSLADRLDLGAAVTFHGHVADPWPLAARAAVYVQASRNGETQGLALRQARLVGLPTVATDLPAWADLPDGAPVRVAVGDVAALADAVATAVVEGAPGRDDACDPHDPAATAEALLDLYRRVLA